VVECYCGWLIRNCGKGKVEVMRVLITGGAGFIGSNLADSLLADGHEVAVIDNLATGFRENIAPEVDFFEGSITDIEIVRSACAGADAVVHLAAARAVSQSVEHPIETTEVNVLGTMNVLVAARDAGASRYVFASSSSVYGGADALPTSEAESTQPRSPYAVCKLAAEEFARVFHDLYGLETVALRFFNVFGPRQRPDSQYAAVIPLFVEALANGTAPEVHGDGEQSRDFTYIDNVVAGIRCAIDAPGEVAAGNVYNLAAGGRFSLLDLLDQLEQLLDSTPERNHVETRAGDIKHSQADVEAAKRDLGFNPTVGFDEGLRRTVEWMRSR